MGDRCNWINSNKFYIKILFNGAWTEKKNVNRPTNRCNKGYEYLWGKSTHTHTWIDETHTKMKALNLFQMAWKWNGLKNKQSNKSKVKLCVWNSSKLTPMERMGGVFFSSNCQNTIEWLKAVRNWHETRKTNDLIKVYY